MKKTYINPEMDIVKIGTQQMLAASGVAVFDDLGGGEAILQDEELDPGLVGDEVLSRMFDDFDNEDF